MLQQTELSYSEKQIVQMITGGLPNQIQELIKVDSGRIDSVSSWHE